jgi:hypothetical protein
MSGCQGAREKDAKKQIEAWLSHMPETLANLEFTSPLYVITEEEYDQWKAEGAKISDVERALCQMLETEHDLKIRCRIVTGLGAVGGDKKHSCSDRSPHWEIRFELSCCRCSI